MNLKSVLLFIFVVVFIVQTVPFSGATSTIGLSVKFSDMLMRAEALVNYEWTPSERIYTWNDNLYNGKNYFEKGEIVKGVPYTLFAWELGFDGLLSLEQYDKVASINYSTEAYCNSVSANRIGPVYGNCCATLVSEVFGGKFMNGSNPRYDGVGTVQNAQYSTTYKNVKLSAIQPGDALSCTSGAHIIWVGAVDQDNITIYESTPPVCRKVVLNKSESINSSGYLVYGGNVYNIVTKSNELLRDDLSSVALLSDKYPHSVKAYTKTTEKTVVYDTINGTAKTNKIYGTDLCFIDAIFENGWCHVNFPLDAGGLDHGYVESSVFFEEGEINEGSINSSVSVYSRDDFLSVAGKTIPGDGVYFICETDNAYQIIYPVTTGGYKSGWVTKADLDDANKDVFLNNLCPIKGYPCVDSNFEVKQIDYVTRGGEIYTTDYCTINQIYSDGWCEVTFPMDSGGERTAYTPISNFVYDVDYGVVSYKTSSEIDVYPKKELTNYSNWYTGAGDTIYIIGAYNDSLQICYPIDEAYGGGYKFGWIHRDTVSLDEYMPGDLNEDGRVNNKDLGLLQRYINDFQVEISLSAADVNDDSTIDITDFEILQKYLNGWGIKLK